MMEASTKDEEIQLIKDILAGVKEVTKDYKNIFKHFEQCESEKVTLLIKD